MILKTALIVKIKKDEKKIQFNVFCHECNVNPTPKKTRVPLKPNK